MPKLILPKVKAKDLISMKKWSIYPGDKVQIYASAHVNQYSIAILSSVEAIAAQDRWCFSLRRNN
jgi:hypothetical protein